MGLSKIPKNGPNLRFRQPFRQGRFWLFPLAVFAIGALLATLGEAGRVALSYDRAAIAAGDVWRLVSGHLVHLGWAHFLLNGAGILLVWLLVGQVYSVRQWLIVMVATIVGIDLGFWFLYPALGNYVGLSGVLHGLLVAGLIAELPARRADTRLLLIGVLLKLIYEQFAGPIPGSESTAGGNVIVDAHLYGAVSGAVVGALMLIRVRPDPAI